LPAKMTTAIRATADAVRPAVAARRLMRLLRLGGAWDQVAAWIDRRRPAAQIDDWSAPLVDRAGSTQARNWLDSLAENPEGTAAAESSVSMPTTMGADIGPILRCLLVTPRLDAGGMEEVIAFLAHRLPSRGLQTAVLCTSPEAIVDGQVTGRAAEMLQAKGVEVFAAEPRQSLDWAKLWRPDVISAHGAPAWAFALARRLGVPYIDNLHSWNGLIGRDWRWHSQGVRSGDLAGVVAVSDLLRQQQLAVNPGFPPERIVTIPNGVDDERFTLVDRAAVRDWLGLTDEYLFVSLGRFCMQKNSYGLITAFGDVAGSRPEVHLAIAGKIDEPRYYRRVLQLRDTMPCKERIHLRDHILTPAQLLAGADGFVLDSFFEGWPLASMEALVAGLPVIIADVSGAREQIAGEPARGYVVANPLGDPLKADWASSAAAQYRPQANREELAAAMELLAANRHDYLCNRARLTAESAARFSTASWLARHAAVLRAAAEGAALPDTWALPPTVETSH
jgi:glycosyltransferase involved in cell wall biosynthesis